MTSVMAMTRASMQALGMRITDGLLGEHALFYPIFDALEVIANEAQTSVEIQRAFDAIGPAIVTHAKIEDEVLFPKIDLGVIAVMRAEHREIDTLVAGVASASSLAQTRAVAQRLIDLLRDHFHREEEVLFPMCESTLSDAQLEQLGDHYLTARHFSPARGR